jgi:hypothetical protein
MIILDHYLFPLQNTPEVSKTAIIPPHPHTIDLTYFEDQETMDFIYPSKQLHEHILAPSLSKKLTSKK